VSERHDEKRQELRRGELVHNHQRITVSESTEATAPSLFWNEKRP
jgi:hypothetical protein